MLEKHWRESNDSCSELESPEDISIADGVIQIVAVPCCFQAAGELGVHTKLLAKCSFLVTNTAAFSLLPERLRKVLQELSPAVIPRDTQRTVGPEARWSPVRVACHTGSQTCSALERDSCWPVWLSKDEPASCSVLGTGARSNSSGPALCTSQLEFEFEVASILRYSCCRCIQGFCENISAHRCLMWHKDQKSVCALVLAIVNEAQTAFLLIGLCWLYRHSEFLPQ